MSTELVVPDADGVIPHPPLTLFGTDDPVAVVERASVVATALADVIRDRHLAKRIGQSDHVFVEGWTLLGSMLGVFAEVEWSRLLDDEIEGWEARAVARTLNGHLVGAAESMCSRREAKWKTSDAYAMRSMAQTRAVSKALRLPLGFIMELAGYSATPAEEMAGTESGQSEPVSSTPAGRRLPATPAPNYRREELAELMKAKGLTAKGLEDYATLVGIPEGSRATEAQMDRLIEAVSGHGSDTPLDLFPEEEAIPPKPGSDEYRALPAFARSSARAYWAKQEVTA